MPEPSFDQDIHEVIKELPEDGKLVFILCIAQYKPNWCMQFETDGSTLGLGYYLKRKRACAKPKGKKTVDIGAVEAEAEGNKLKRLVHHKRNTKNQQKVMTMAMTTTIKAKILLYMCLFPVQLLLSVMLPTNQSKHLKITAWSPFTSNSKNNYKTFLSLVTKTVMCSVDSLDHTPMEWKFNWPANAKLKPLMSEMCYNAMVSTVLGHKKDFVVTISMKSPQKHINNVVSLSIFAETLTHLDFAAMANQR